MEPAKTGRSGLGTQETQFFLKKPENKTLLMYFGASLLMYFGSEPQRCIALGESTKERQGESVTH